VQLSLLVRRARSGSAGAARRPAAVGAAEARRGFLERLFEERRRATADDLITGLPQVVEAGDKLSEKELQGMVCLQPRKPRRTDARREALTYFGRSDRSALYKGEGGSCYLIGDGQPGGWRTSRSGFPERLLAAGFGECKDLAKLQEVRDPPAGVLGAERVLFGCEGFHAVGGRRPIPARPGGMTRFDGLHSLRKIRRHSRNRMTRYSDANRSVAPAKARDQPPASGQALEIAPPRIMWRR
jgi:hypothetical protein